MKLLLIPTSDWIRHPIPSRLHFIFERLGKNNEIHIINFENTRWKIARDTSLYLHKMKGLPVKDLALYYALNSPFHYSKIKSIIRDENIDAVVYAHVLAGSASILASRKYKVPVVCDYLDHFPESAAIYYDNLAIKKIVYNTVNAITQWNLKNTDLTVTVSSSFSKKLIANGVNNVAIIPNGVELDRFHPIDRDEALSKVGLDGLKDKFIICYVGSIERWIDLDTIVKGIKILKKKGIPAVFLCIGGSIAGQYFEEIKNIEEIVATGFVDYEKVCLYINASDICVLPLLQMDKNLTIPLKLLQYFACGRPVFSLPNSELEGRFSGALTIYRDAQEFSDLAYNYALCKDMHNEKVKNGILMSKDYSWEQISKDYENILTKLIEKS